MAGNVVMYRRKKQRQKHHASPAFVLLVVCFLFLVIIASYLVSPLALVDEVSVLGVKNLTASEILEQSGLNPGIHIWQTNLGQARSKLIQNPWLNKVTIRRVLPQQIIITVEENEPLAMMIMPDSGNELILSASGVVISLNKGFSLPYITGHAIEALSVGEIMQEERVVNALITLDSLPQFGAEISELNLEHYPTYLELFTTDGFRVLLNTGPVETAKGNDLREMLSQLRSQHKKGTLDMRGKTGRVIYSPYSGDN